VQRHISLIIDKWIFQWRKDEAKQPVLSVAAVNLAAWWTGRCRR
jgi:hypothetical protein